MAPAPAPVGTDAPPVPPGRRERNRQDRARAYLDAAMEVATRDGLGAVTMQRLADEVDAAVGTVYTYFPSKGALVAELQRVAIERLTEAYRELRDRSGSRLAAWDRQDDAALARLAVFGHFWIASVWTYPQEAALLHALVSESEQVVPDEELYRVLPAATALLDEAREAVESATRSGAIGAQEPMDLVIRWAAALTGALLTSNLASLNPLAFDGSRLAVNLQRDLLLGWGGSVAAVDRAEAHVEELRSEGSFGQRRP